VSAFVEPLTGILTPEEALKQFMQSNGFSSLSEDNWQTTDAPSAKEAFGPDAQERVQWVIQNVPGVVDAGVSVESKYVIKDNRLVPVFDMEVQLTNGDHWLRVFSHMGTGNVVQLADWVSHVHDGNHHSYRAYPMAIMDPLEGEQTIVEDPEDAFASPLGWHDHGEGERDDTVGNNVWAQYNPLGRSDFKTMYRPRGKMSTFDHKKETVLFDFPQVLNSTKDSVDNSVTNLFVRVNYLHDLFYHAGFDEPSGNFQDNNFNRGGKDQDGVIAHAQDGTYMNNADFSTPPDGRRGRMRMYNWNVIKPIRDGDYDNAIITHEFAHGVTIRLTGGPANVNCLMMGQSGGMGEGWGDAFALFFGMKPHHTKTSSLSMGVFVYGKGIRHYPYTTDIKVNPYKYTDISKNREVHAMGEIWATVLLEMYWVLAEKYGIEYDWRKFRDSKRQGNMPGNFLAFQLVVDALKLQPCRPTFLQARDAILAADRAGFEGKNQCLIWTAFAKRGMGVDAVESKTDGYAIPSECQQ
jgi:extracellular elastinolytic metalloproteinase